MTTTAKQTAREIAKATVQVPFGLEWDIDRNHLASRIESALIAVRREERKRVAAMLRSDTLNISSDVLADLVEQLGDAE